MRNFKELRIWQKGLDIAVNCFKIVTDFPREEKFGIAVQITKSGVSIPSNIAEGSSRSSEKEYGRFLEIALGSCYELETQFIIAQKVGMGNLQLIEKLIFEIREEQKMISGLTEKLKR